MRTFILKVRNVKAQGIVVRSTVSQNNTVQNVTTFDAVHKQIKFKLNPRPAL